MNIDKFVDALMNIQLIQVMTQTMGNIFHTPGPMDAFSGLFSSLFQMLMPVMFLGIFMKMFEKFA